MTTRPTDTPDWASSPTAPAVVVEPPTPLQTKGWDPFDTPPSGNVNWAWNRFAIWVQHFAGASSVFTSMEAAVNAPATAPFVIGDTCLVDEADGGLPGAVVTTLFPGVVTEISACGAFVAGAADDGGGDLEIQIANRDGSGLIKTLVPTSVGVFSSIKRMRTDGVDVIFTYIVTTGSVQTVESINIATGLSNWAVAPLVGGAIEDIAWNQDHVFVASSDAARQLVALNRSTGATVYAYDHGANLRSVEAGGLLVFVSGLAGTGAFTTRGVLSLTGADATGSGGLGTSAFAWEIVQVGAIGTSTRRMATDSKTLFAGEGALGTTVVQRYSIADGVAITGTIPPGSDIIRLAVDQDYLYISNTGIGAAFDKNSGAKIWNSALTGGRIMVADGTAAFESDSRLARGNFGPIRFKRINPATATHVAMRQLLVPTDIK